MHVLVAPLIGKLLTEKEANKNDLSLDGLTPIIISMRDQTFNLSMDQPMILKIIPLL
jgi:hypothetical protein